MEIASKNYLSLYGVMSTVILTKALRGLKCDVSYYIPNRETEGYGLNKDAIISLKEAEIDLIITCDNGITALEEIELIKKLDMKVIVIDHHEPIYLCEEDLLKIDILPQADSIINPKQQDCNYKFKFLCAAGICYKFAKKLYSYFDVKFELDDELLVFAMIATICDVVDLIDENRIIVKNGLDIINSKYSLNMGLDNLIKIKNIGNDIISVYTIGFILGPCVNATGRLEKATIAVELFLEQNNEVAHNLAQKLSTLNEERKIMTSKSIENIMEKINNLGDKSLPPILFLYDDQIHEAIAGIIAGRIKDTFFRPTIVFTKSKEYLKASARSIESYNMYENLSICRELFEKFGGHSMAAGLSIKEENFEKFKTKLLEKCNLSEDDFIKIIKIDKEIKLEEICLPLADELKFLEPFGKANKEPIFLTKNLFICSIRIIENKNTIIMNITQDKQIDFKIKAICFGNIQNFRQQVCDIYSEEYFENILDNKYISFDMKIDLVYTLNINIFKNLKSLQLNIKDFLIY